MIKCNWRNKFYSGYNQEDSVVVNQSGIETSYSTFIEHIKRMLRKSRRCGEEELICHPSENTIKMKPGHMINLISMVYLKDTKVDGGVLIIGKKLL